MLSLRSIATAVVAILLGLIAIVMVNNYLKAGQGAASAPSDKNAGVSVVVAAADINRGVTLEPVVLKVVKYPADAVPAGAFHAVGEVAPATGAGRVTLRAINANEPILPSELAGSGVRQTLSATIAPGMEAVSIRSNDVAGVGGFVLPGDHVDVLLTRAVVQGLVTQTNWITHVLAQDVRVLGVDQVSDQNAQSPVVARAVTIEVDHTQAQAIALGQSAGQISLSLRRDGDHSAYAKHVTTVSDLGGDLPAPVRAKVVRASGPVIHITRGALTTEYRMGGR
jgi:pilus assembly protein CpaB